MSDARDDLRACAEAMADALDALLEAMADSECADPGRKYAPECLEAAKRAEALLHEYRGGAA